MAEENIGKQKGGRDALELPYGHSKRVLWNNYIAAVNGALRFVAARQSLPIIDYERIMLQLPTAHLHSADGFHPLVRVRLERQGQSSDQEYAWVYRPLMQRQMIYLVMSHVPLVLTHRPCAAGKIARQEYVQPAAQRVRGQRRRGRKHNPCHIVRRLHHGIRMLVVCAADPSQFHVSRPPFANVLRAMA